MLSILTDLIESLITATDGSLQSVAAGNGILPPHGYSGSALPVPFYRVTAAA